jgi:hypothetical protein
MVIVTGASDGFEGLVTITVMEGGVIEGGKKTTEELFGPRPASELMNCSRRNEESPKSDADDCETRITPRARPWYASMDVLCGFECELGLPLAAPSTIAGPPTIENVKTSFALKHWFPFESTIVALTSAVSNPSKNKEDPVPVVRLGASKERTIEAGDPKDCLDDETTCVIESAAYPIAVSIPGAYVMLNFAIPKAGTACLALMTPFNDKATKGAFEYTLMIL